MIKQASAMLIALVLVPTLALAAMMEGTVVKLDRGKNQIVVKTEEGEKTLRIAANTKGLDHAKEGAKVKIQYSQKGGQLVASEIFLLVELAKRLLRKARNPAPACSRLQGS